MTNEGRADRLHWVGLDVAKESFDAAWLNAKVESPVKRLAQFPVRSFARTPEGVESFLGWVDACLEEDEDAPQGMVRCVMEATGRYSMELALWLLERRPGLAPAIAPPGQTAAFLKSLGLRNATDALAARGLAVYGRERAPEAYAPPSARERELRELSRYRDDLVRQRTMLKNQMQEKTSSAFVARDQAKRLRAFDRNVERIEKQLRALVQKDAELRRDVELLETIFGVGFLTAVVVRAELGDLRRFGRARELTAFAGLNPSVRQSGTSVRGKTRMGKHGNPRVRAALYMSAMAVIRGQNALRRMYERLIENGKTHMAALGAVMRKQLVLMRAVLVHQTPYDDNWTRGGKLAVMTP
jgi:transposase